jgi:ActR/RegA family two-component response regulator
MHMKKTAKFVLLLESDSTAIRESAMELAGIDGYLLIARTPAAAVEFAKQYKPAYAVLPKKCAAAEEKSLQDLLLQFSPETEIVLLKDQESIRAMGQGV